MAKKTNKGKNFKEEFQVIKEAIGKKISKRRKEIDLNTKVLASKVGLSQSSISNIEKGKQAITSERLWQFCVALKCTPNDLLPPIPDEVKKFDKNLEKIENEQWKDFAKTIINIT